jgi:hypothetical protein
MAGADLRAEAWVENETMIQPMISLSAGTASVDVRTADMDFRDVDDVLESLHIYMRAGAVKRVVVDSRGRIFLPGPVEMLIRVLVARGRRYGIEVEVAEDARVPA